MNLNPSQQAAVTATAPRILLLAAAGSGKSRVLVERIRRMIGDGINPSSIVASSIVAITFTNSAAKVIQERLVCAECAGRGWNTNGGSPPEQIPCDTCGGFESACNPTLGYVGTLHGWMLRLLQQHGTAIGLASKLTVLDDAEAEAILVKTMADMAWKGTRKAVDTEIELGYGKYHFNHLTSGPHPTGTRTEVERIAYEYWWRLMTSGCLTFDMILELGLELVQLLGIPRQGQYEHLRRFEHLLSDETQDCAAIDFKIYEAMPFKTRFLVGDARQRIMSFRGSCDGFEQLAAGAGSNPLHDKKTTAAEAVRLTGNGWQLLHLADNYRSGMAICRAANNLMPHDLPMVPVTPLGDMLKLQPYDTAAEEAAGVATAIKSQIHHGTYEEEIALLVRTNKLASEYREVLRAHGVTVAERPPADNPPDWPAARAFIALLTNPESNCLAHRFIATKDGEEQRADQIQRDATADFETINEKFLHIRHMQLADVTTAMVSANLSRESTGRVRALIERLQPDATLPELQAAIIEAETEAMQLTPGVQVKTAHSSKGEQYECVFIAAAEEKIWPSGRADTDIEEEKRLFYVAVTRAKRLVYISYAKRRNREWSGPQIMEPSRFIAQLLGS